MLHSGGFLTRFRFVEWQWRNVKKQAITKVNMQMKRTSTALASMAFVSAALVACGGGGGDNAAVTAPPASSTSISGVAATGQAMAGATITLKDANGVSATKTADAAGSYSFDVTNLTAPFVITASLQVGDTQLTLTSMLADKPAAGSTGTANVTPLTNAMAALLAPNGNPEELAAAGVSKTAVTKAKLDDVAAKIRAAIENILKDAGLDPAKFDPVTTVFTANRLGADRVLELVRVELTGQGVSLTNPSALDDGNGSASVQITPATTTVAPLPAPPAGTTLDALDHIATLLDTCFADAPAVRVTAQDAAGTPTALSAACDAVPMASNYKSGGYNALSRYAGLLKSADLTGAKFSKPERLFTYAGAAPKVYFRLPYKTAAGAGGILTDVAEQTNPANKPYTWQIVGNQRDYDSTVDARLDNVNQLNPNNTSESAKGQYRVALRLFFNPINAAGLNVQTVRVKGPGLPTSGVVMHRSSVCGTNDYMTISNKTGSLVNSAGAAQLYNSGTANAFRLAAELKSGTFDWTKVGASSSWRDTAMADADLAAIPSFAEYTWELWTFNPGRAYRSSLTLTNATAPDITYTQRLTSRPPAVTSLKTLSWNSIDANDYLNPASVLAAPQTAVTLGWKSSAEPVDYATVFGQRNAAAAGTTPASFVRISADTAATGVKISDTSKTVSPVSDPAGTASLAGITGVTPPVVNCASAQFPSFDAVAGTKDAVNSYATYRDMTVRSRSYSLARKYVTNSWSNFLD
jgi:hypothetical protein